MHKYTYAELDSLFFIGISVKKEEKKEMLMYNAKNFDKKQINYLQIYGIFYFILIFYFDIYYDFFLF